jgi:signal transduction histidine kinase
MHPLLSRQLKRYFGDEVSVSHPWPEFFAAISDVYRDIDTHRETLERSLVLSSEELHQGNAEMRAVFQAIPDLLFRLNRDGTILELKAGTMTDLLHPPRYLIGKRIQNVPDKRVGEQFREALQHLQSQKSMVNIEYSLTLEEQECFFEARLVPLLTDQIVVIIRNISKRKQTEAELEESHKHLLEMSRMAGMADVAAGVLHNVGNVLNSVNVSTQLVYNAVKSSRVSTFFKVADMLRQHAADLPAFLTEDERGKTVPDFLAKLAEALNSERTSLLKELDALASNISHLCEVVTMQRSLTSFTGIRTTVTLGELIDDAIKINGASLQRHHVEVIHDFNPAILLTTDCHKVLQILINLVSNAKDAVVDAACPAKKITLHAHLPDPNTLQIAVIDNGVGIEPENKTCIFSLGFTTKKNGHGFGLHSSAMAAAELGGALKAHSDGPGKGATFLLTLPGVLNNRPESSHPFISTAGYGIAEVGLDSNAQ